MKELIRSQKFTPNSKARITMPFWGILRMNKLNNVS